ncbi:MULTISPECIES: 50S ribosomal protein L3 N(5)-glutamine methyltransferase [Alcaligenes]|uniref:Ribosomal protein uL3 glutamine methyltransferase n=1 Tax=Alcaligenes ammonioxydans TaxID=2582914 RepID=A0ABX8SRW9_9BURK|nr:50S ribosomal protein L3 N(5)-glutamine methyltransferase [Alcaligenes ammonioxydans]EJC63168.1 N5-glutamine S-adenosyl-L-methionine-dependent methyltransferase [Alcaligenes faecalis subsp. faecalis NCIB 8687]QBH20755.1 50S ribosomal protein L3 N(5)-glutamine methyltransferase [Alcaligenes faecalis]QXX78782.1 50S ribosomal protein L3 N(5)-glutamine methyltransferase [Alcaligenes ammonioxydans]HRK84254.1 50S ribosomal protein L3 N(5)-glutamine methyltransferase [Alcaligenes faecalis]
MLSPCIDHSSLLHAQQELRTVRDLLRWSVSQFNRCELAFGHGSDNAWDEAAYLLLHTLHLPLDTLDPYLDAIVLESERAAYLALIARRCNERVPAAYLTGEAWLQGHRFRVTPDTIVPRSPIAELLAEQLQPWIADPDAIYSALDLCTGSGCLAILTALAFPQAQVDAVDLSDAALEVAQSNIDAFGLNDRMSLFKSDLLDQVPQTAYDLIICNPPYVNEQSMQNLPQEYRHEPQLALAGGDDGMDLVRRILEAAPNYLSPEGVLVLEIGNEYDNFVAAFPELEPIWLSTETAEDQILLLSREQLAP